MTPRQSIIARATTLREEIRQYFDDVAHWNTQVRRDGDAPVDPDPDGKLRRIARGIDRMLLEEGASRAIVDSVKLDELYGVVHVDPPLAYAASETALAFVGCPILLDEAVPVGVVEMRCGGRVVSRLTFPEDSK
ncbi:MAG: hypothetical protein AB7O67_16670 [Vicinamibacterales bacterium]